MALQDSWCDRAAFSALCAAIAAWQARRSVPRTEHGAALAAVPANVILVRGPTGVGKRSVVDAALRYCQQGQLARTHPLIVRRPDLSDVVDDEAVCGPCALLRPTNAGAAEGVDADSLASFVDVPGFDKTLSSKSADTDTVVVLDRLDIVFPASLHGGGRGGDDNDGKAESGRPTGLLTFGANGGAGIGATSGLVALAGRLTSRAFDSLVIVTTVSSGGLDALHPLLGQAVQVAVDVVSPSLNTRREFFRRSLSRQLLLSVDRPASGGVEAKYEAGEGADTEHETAVAAQFLDWVAEEMAARNGGASFHRLQVLVRDLARDPRFVARVRGAMLGEPVVASVACGFVAEAIRNRPNASNGDGVGAAEQPQSERVRWEDVVGLDDVKQKLRFAAAALRVSPRAAGEPTPLERFMRAHTEPYVSGILLYGLPGTGKTMLAKALATEASAAFMTANVSDLVHSFVGESERRVRELFAQARKWAPSVVFLDEVQAAFGGGDGDRSAGHEDRLVATLIEEMDACRDHGTDTGARVLVVAATNVPGRIGKGLLGPGRLEEHVHVPPPPAEATVGIIEAVLSRWGWDGAVADDGGDDNEGWRIATDVAEALAMREGALWSAADVAAAMNLVGLDVAARLAAASADGTVSRDAMRHALNTRSAVLSGVGKAAVANVQPSGSQMMLMELRSWRSNLRDVASLSFATATPTGRR